METVVVRKKALEDESLYFDPRFDMIEEADLFRRISYRWKIAGIPEPLAKWRVHGSSWTFKYPHLLKKETELMLEDFRRRIPDFDKIYSAELVKLSEGIVYLDARNVWIQGNKWPLVRFLFKSKRLLRKIFAVLVAVWPSSHAAFVLRLKGEILPASFFNRSAK